jgi:TonB family protein
VRSAIWVVVVGLALGCPGRGNRNPAEAGPPLPKDFTPPPPLGPEPPAPEGLAGRPWLDAAHERLYSAWAQGFLEQCRVYLPPTHPLNDMSLAATAELALRPDGELASVKITQPSGNADFDAAVLAVARDAGPYPAPPPELVSDDGLTYVLWLFARDQRQVAIANARFDKRQWTPEQAVPSLLAAGRWDEAARRVLAGAQAGADAKQTVALARDVSAHIVAAALADGQDATPRVEAALAAGRAKLAALAPALRELARGASDLALRKASIEALGLLGDREAMPVLADAVTALDGDRSAAAARAMARWGARLEAWQIVAPRLEDKDPNVRLAALATVVEIGAPQSVPVLAARLGDKGAPRPERVLAARALGEVLVVGVAGSGAVDISVKPLAAALLDGDAAVRAAAAAAFARAGQAGYRSRGAYYKLEPLLKDKDPSVRAAAALAVAAVQPDVAGPQLYPLIAKEKNRTVLEAHATALGLVPGAESLKRLLKLADAPEPSVRAAALAALAGRPEPEAKQRVAALAGAEDPALRLLAVRAGDAGVAAAALGDASLDVRVAALEQLVRLQGGVEALPRFVELLLAATTTVERVRYAEAFLVGTAA